MDADSGQNLARLRLQGQGVLLNMENHHDSRRVRGLPAAVDAARSLRRRVASFEAPGERGPRFSGRLARASTYAYNSPLKDPYRDSGIDGHSLISRSPKRFKQEAMEFFSDPLVCCLTNTIACQRPFLVTKHIVFYGIKFLDREGNYYMLFVRQHTSRRCIKADTPPEIALLLHDLLHGGDRVLGFTSAPAPDVLGK